MNKYIIVLSLIISSVIQAQVGIEKTSLRSPEGSLLEFNDTAETNGVAKGIILPIVDNIDTNSVSGTFYVDASTNKVVCIGDNSIIELTPASSTNIQAPSLADIGEGVVITENASFLASDSAPGVLKLSSDSRALLLPHVESTNDIVNPEVGTMVYENTSNSLAVFNGEVWSFWTVD